MAESATIPAKVKRGGKGKQKIEIKKMEKKSNRYVTFSKRKVGLFKKAAELSTLTGADVAVVICSQAGKVHSFGSPSVDAVTDSYLHCGSFPEEERCERMKEKKAEMWWGKPPEEMGLEELLRFKSSLEALLRERVAETAKVMAERESMLPLECTENENETFGEEIMRLLGE